MTRHDPPNRSKDIERAYRRLQRGRWVRPCLLATRLKEWLPSLDGGLILLFSAAVGMGAVGIASAVDVEKNLGPAVALALLLGFPGLGALLLAVRHWARLADASPYRGKAEDVVNQARADPRLMTVVGQWLRDSNLGSLSHNQVAALEQTLDKLENLRAWERRHAELHRYMDEQLGLIAQVRAEDMDGSLPVAAATGPARRL